MRPADERRDKDGQSAPHPAEVGLFRDIPGWVWTAFLGAWAALFGLFVLFFASGAQAAFIVATAVFFALMAFGLPLALAAQSKCDDYDCRGIVQTRTGPVSVRAAATQIVIIPVGAVIGLIVFIVLVM